MINKIVSILLFASISLHLFSQNHTVRYLDEQKTVSRGSTFIGVDENGFVYSSSFRTYYAVLIQLYHSYIKVYDSKNGRVITEKKVTSNKELSQLGYKYIDFMIKDNKPVILCEKKGQGKDHDYYLVDIDEHFNIIGTPYKVGVNPNCKTFLKTKSVDLFFAEDIESSLKLTLSEQTCKVGESITLHSIFRGKNNEIIHDLPLTIDIPQLSSLRATIYDENRYYLSILSFERKKQEGKLLKRTEKNHILLGVDKNGETSEINLDVLSNGNRIGAFRVSKSKDKLLFSGQIINKFGQFAGVFTGVIDPKNNEISDVNEQYFTSEFVKRFWTEKAIEKANKKDQKNNDDDDGFKGNYKLITSFPTDDGGLVNFYQKYWVKVVTSTRRDANGNMTTTTDYYYNYGELIPVKTNNKGDIEWVELIPAFQVTKNYDPGTSFLATQKNEDVYIFYNASNEQTEMIEEGAKSKSRKKLKDRIRKNATIVKIDKQGVLSQEKIIDLREDRSVHFDPGSMGVDADNHKIIMINNIKAKKSNLIVVEY
jgi:hypothetical protein